MPLAYHQAAFDLLGKAPRVSRAAARLLDRREAALGVKLPPSVREWYSFQGDERLIAEHGGDRPVPLKALGDPHEVGLGWLRVLDECQGVAAWYVRLDGSDDPPVHVHSEMAGTPEDEVRVRDADDEEFDFLVDFPHWWRPAAPSFSAFVRQRIVTHGGDATSRAAVAVLHDRSTSPNHVATLDGRGRIVGVHLGVGYTSGPGHPKPKPQLPDHLFALLRGQAHLRELSIGPWKVSAAGWAALRGHPSLAALTLSARSYRVEAVETLLDLPALRSLDLFEVPIEDDDLARLLAGLRLTAFKFSSERAPNRGLAALGHQTGLERAELIARGALSDEGVSGLARLSRLKQLGVRGGHVTDAGLAHLAGLRALRDLGLEAPKVTDAGLALLARLTKPEAFALHAPKVTDAGLAHLGGLTSLRTLALHETRVRGPGFRHLGRLTHLRSLTVVDSPIGDGAVVHLVPLAAFRTRDHRHSHHR